MKGNPCSQCGECCRWLVLGEIAELSTDERRYYALRGAVERGELLVLEHPCTMLAYERDENPAGAGTGGDTGAGIVRARCTVHDGKPAICRMYDGRRRQNGMVFFIPDGCAMAAGREKRTARK